MRNFGHIAVMSVAVVLILSLMGNLALAGPSSTASIATHQQYDKDGGHGKGHGDGKGHGKHHGDKGKDKDKGKGSDKGKGHSK